MKSLVPSGDRTMPLFEWFSSERGKPRIISTASQLPPSSVSRVMTPELVSRSFDSPLAAIRGSLEETYNTGCAGVPVTTIPVTWRLLLVSGAPLSSRWFCNERTASKPLANCSSSCAVAMYSPLTKVTLNALIEPFCSAT